jgi:hypothetical protein
MKKHHLMHFQLKKTFEKFSAPQYQTHMLISLVEHVKVNSGTKYNSMQVI